ncbi:hypothetical protein PUR28_00875, partial [Streptomyces sp. BE308]|nr:hypothetical protein [Streptomyces sp. BE308]
AAVLPLHRLTVRAPEQRADQLHTAVGDTADLQLQTSRVAAEYRSLTPAPRLRAPLGRALDGPRDIRARLAAREAASLQLTAGSAQYHAPSERAGAPPPR